MRIKWITTVGLLMALANGVTFAADEPNFTRQEDVIYGRKYGVALTLDVLTPKAKPNRPGHRLLRQRRLFFLA